jgi:hypothetical protein
MVGILPFDPNTAPSVLDSAELTTAVNPSIFFSCCSLDCCSLELVAVQCSCAAWGLRLRPRPQATAAQPPSQGRLTVQFLFLAADPGTLSIIPMHNNLYYRIGSGWYQPLSQGFRRRTALLLYALLGAVGGPTGALALAAYGGTELKD